MPFRSSKTRLLAVSAAALVVSATGADAAINRGFFSDHSLCCGPKPLVNAEALPLVARVSSPVAIPVAASLASTSPAPASTGSSVSNPAPTSTAPSTTARPSNAPEEVNGYLKLGFDRLSSFAFNPAPYDPAKPNEPPPSSADQIPDTIKSYSGKRAIVSGFMLPVKTEKGLVTEFLLMRDAMMCCYGVVPNINEWIVVKMTNGGVQAIQDVPLAVYGKLTVKELYESGYLSGIYLLEGEKMTTAKL